MARSSNQIDVYLEIGKKRTFAGVIDWPGWCRSGRDEGSALQALLEYGPRYARSPRDTARVPSASGCICARRDRAAGGQRDHRLRRARRRPVK